MKSSTGQTDSVIARQAATAKKRQTVMAEAQKDEAAIWQLQKNCFAYVLCTINLV